MQHFFNSLRFFCFLFISFACASFASASDSVPSKKKVLICGVCKNIEPALPNTIRNIEALGKKFKKYAAIIYENNSTDMTAKILADWARRNKHVVFISENLTKEQLSSDARCFSWEGTPSRMEVIARARNIVLSHARKPEYNSFDYLIMVDLDFKKPWPIKQILKTIRKKGDWDCICANGMSADGAYYDRYAFRNKRYPFGPEVIGENWWKGVAQKPLTLPSTKKLLPVYSAFGGLAIYKRASIINFSYSGHVTKALEVDSKRILQSLPRSNFFAHTYLTMIGKAREPDLSTVPMIFRENSGYEKYPVCCEHVTLHASMRLHGFGKIYINPKMIMQTD